jgi:hypothetical protein
MTKLDAQTINEYRYSKLEISRDMYRPSIITTFTFDSRKSTSLDIVIRGQSMRDLKDKSKSERTSACQNI